MVGELTDGHSPSNKEVIVDLLDEINIIDTSRRFPLRMPRWATTRARWTWSQKRQGARYCTQPDYFIARAGEIAHYKGVGLDPRGTSTRTIAQLLQTFGWEGQDG